MEEPLLLGLSTFAPSPYSSPPIRVPHPPIPVPQPPIRVPRPPIPVPHSSIPAPYPPIPVPHPPIRVQLSLSIPSSLYFVLLCAILVLVDIICATLWWARYTSCLCGSRSSTWRLLLSRRRPLEHVSHAHCWVQLVLTTTFVTHTHTCTYTAPNVYTENEQIAKYEIMDGAPVRGQKIPAFIGHDV